MKKGNKKKLKLVYKVLKTANDEQIEGELNLKGKTNK